uniref:Uncharacterized protein n=1 Tax=Russula compacta TaxID=40490 RepID=A0A2S0U3K3_9AGAM|nr:hypothetical protein [Russula compacta]AWB36069.1 hypothetical protein [Russula compacta]
MNALIVGLFGFSIFDLWGFDLFKGWMGWVRETAVYIWFAALIATKGYTKRAESEYGWEVKGVDRNTTSPTKRDIRNRWENTGDNRGFDWNTPETTGIIDASDDNTYIYLLMLLIVAGFAYYYRDDLYDVGNTLINWFRRRPDNPPTDSPLIQDPNPEGFPYIEETVNRNIFDRIRYVIWGDPEAQGKLKDSVKDKFYGIKDNTSQETITPMASSSKVKLDSRVTNSENPIASTSRVESGSDLAEYFKDDPATLQKLSNFEQTLKNKHMFGKGKEPSIADLDDASSNRSVFAQVIGENLLKFEDEASTLMRFINKFISHQKIGDFPNVAIQQAIYYSLRCTLAKLSLNTKLYDKWLYEPGVENKIDQFIALEDDVYQEDAAKVEEQLVDEGVHTWMEDTNITQNVSPTPQSPVETEIVETQAQVETETLQIETEPSPPPSNSGFGSLLEQIKARRNSIAGSPEGVNETIAGVEQQSTLIETQQTALNSESSSRMSLFDQIRSRRRNDEHIVGSPVRETVEEITQDDQDNFLSTPAVEIVESVNQTEEIQTSENVVEDSIVGSPVVDTSQIIDINNQFEETLALFDDEDDTVVQDNSLPDNKSQVEEIINSWDKVKVDINEDSIKLEFGDMWRYCSKIEFDTINNPLISYDFDPILLNSNEMDKGNISETFNLADLVDLKRHNGKIEIRQIFIRDLEGKTLRIYQNDDWFVSGGASNN